jgi:hypothetical protein
MPGNDTSKLARASAGLSFSLGPASPDQSVIMPEPRTAFFTGRRNWSRDSLSFANAPFHWKLTLRRAFRALVNQPSMPISPLGFKEWRNTP